MDVLDGIPTFYTTQVRRCAELGMDVRPFPVSHVAVRTRTWRDYVGLRDRLEERSSGNLENVWNGRPISKLLLREPVPVGGHGVDLIELIPPFHQRVYRMGLEHVGFVVGDHVDGWAARYKEVLTGQQFQSAICEPYYVLFPDDYTHVKFYRWGLAEVCRREGGSFDGFAHATDWRPADELAGPYEVG